MTEIAGALPSDAIIANEPALKHLDARKATDILYEYIHAARTYGDTARRVLYNKVRRMAGNHKKSRTLMRVAYLVITAMRRTLSMTTLAP